jgi:ketosteroid isomerase-like protein
MMPDKQLFHTFFEVLNHRATKEMKDLLSPDAEFYRHIKSLIKI